MSRLSGRSKAPILRAGPLLTKESAVFSWRTLALLGIGFTAADVSFAPTAQAAASELRLEMSSWRVIERESGPVNYYTLFSKADPPFIRSLYQPPNKTAVLGVQIPDADKSRASKLRWNWR